MVSKIRKTIFLASKSSYPSKTQQMSLNYLASSNQGTRSWMFTSKNCIRQPPFQAFLLVIRHFPSVSTMRMNLTPSDFQHTRYQNGSLSMDFFMAMVRETGCAPKNQPRLHNSFDLRRRRSSSSASRRNQSSLPSNFPGLSKRFSFYSFFIMSLYGKLQYWEDRYSKELEPFDWYQRYAGLKDLIVENVGTESRLLNIGAGNSKLSEEMFEQGYQRITNIDFSATLIKQMSQKYKDKSTEFKYLLMDARAMTFPDASFDAVIDKGTLDSILCSEIATSHASKMIQEVYRVLTGKGVYMVVSYGQPQFRMSLLQSSGLQWQVRVEHVAKSGGGSLVSEDKDSPSVHFVYVCRKGKKI